MPEREKNRRGKKKQIDKFTFHVYAGFGKVL